MKNCDKCGSKFLMVDSKGLFCATCNDRKDVKIMPARYYTDKLIEMIDDEMLNAYDVVIMCVKAMSENDVHWMMDKNELLEEEE